MIRAERPRYWCESLSHVVNVERECRRVHCHDVEDVVFNRANDSIDVTSRRGIPIRLCIRAVHCPYGEVVGSSCRRLCEWITEKGIFLE